jgi:hypothetical protein
MKNRYVAARNAYAYPPVGLVAIVDPIDVRNWRASFSEHRFVTTLQLDQHHADCLLSESSERVVAGVYSVMYWGYITSGAKSVTRCTWISVGNKKNPNKSISYIGKDALVDTVRRASGLLNKGSYGDALLVIQQLPHIGISFGTKLLAFMYPECVGILDDKITKHLSDGSFAAVMDALTLRKLTKSRNETGKQAAARFQAFCEALNTIKTALNQCGAGWRDISGATMNRFRALDVERALFAIAKNTKTA